MYNRLPVFPNHETLNTRTNTLYLILYICAFVNGLVEGANMKEQLC